MPTFIYAPGVKVYISSAKHGIVDVSEDLTEGTMVRRSDGVSTFNFSMSNPRRKYDTVFTPNDRIVVVMKRLAWLRTFTGLLNTVPLVTAWPRTVNIAASCSLKRLMYWYWDQYSSATQNMLAIALKKSVGTDGGVTGLIHTILNEVVGWPSSKVHIGQIPDTWFDIATKVATEVDALAEQSDQLREQYQAILGSGALVAGGAVGTSVNGVLTEGMYGGVALSIEQVGFAETIMSVGRSMGMSDRDLVIGLACAMQESRLRNLDYGDRDSLGLFQQRPSQGWGTPAQIRTPTYAARKFFEGLAKIDNRNSMRETQAAQAVQRSGFPEAYQQWVPMARAVVAKAASGVKPAPATTQKPYAGSSTGAAMAQAGIDFVQKYRVMYKQHSVDTSAYLAQEPPPYLDCGTFCQAMYLRTLGSLGGMPRTVTQISRWALANGGRQLTVEEAFKTPGAIMVKVGHHVEMSIGDGKTTVGAKRTGLPAQLETWPPAKARSYWDYGVTLPGLTYSIGNQVVFSPTANGTTTGGDAAAVDVANPTTGSQLPGYNPNDPIDRLFGNNAWDEAVGSRGGPNTSLADALTGVRALLNDQPLLPYLMNLFNSTMRSFCSAPNGDLIAWFPDYYGLWGTAAKLVVEPIEVLDFNVEWSDDSLVTHMFTLAGQNNFLDISSGSVQTNFATAENGADIRTQTVGIANIDIPSVMWSLFGIEATKEEATNFANYIYRRFGARPTYAEMPGLVGPKAEFFSALFMFMRTWAYQYNADIPLTFMPEAWPGMLIQVPAFDFQAYITTVTHSFRFGDGGSFSTTVNIASPARMPKPGNSKDHVLLGMPLAGNFKPGRGIGNTTAAPVAEAPVGHRTMRGPIL